jgi:glycosyltransferase involved in cell wall biosynthesis
LKKIAIISSHPIQYNAPVFKLLTQRNKINIKVFYSWGDKVLERKFDPGFGRIIEWDIPLLDGYEYEFVKNTSSNPGSHHFKGIINPTIIHDIELYNPDAILIMGWNFKSHLKIIRHFKEKKKIIFRGDSTLLDESTGFSFKKIARRIFLSWVYRHVDIALYVGSANKAYYLKHGLYNDQLFFAPHAIDNSRFINQSNANKEIVAGKRKTLGIPADAIVFLFAGKFEPKKNPGILIDAFVKLNNPDTHLLLVGNGVQEETLKMKVATQKRNIADRIHFMSFQNQSDMPDIYRIGDIYCLPSQGPGETWGLAVNEAMACSKAVLVSDKCGCNIDLVKEGVNGYIVKSNDIDDLYEKMGMIISNNRSEEMGRQSFEIIQEWSYEKICVAIENALI